MVTLPVADYERVIGAAWGRYLDQDGRSFDIQVGAHNIHVDVAMRQRQGHRFYDAGIPGYNMANNQIPAITDWVHNNLTIGGGHGSVTPRKVAPTTWAL